MIERSGARTRLADAGESAPAGPLVGERASSPWRLLASVGAIGAAVAHIPLIDEHLTEAPYIGAGFVLLSIAGLLLGHLLLQADTPAVWLATATVAVLTLAGYLLSRTIGLPQIHDDIGNWGEPLGVVAISSEALMLASAVAHWAGVRRTQRRSGAWFA